VRERDRTFQCNRPLEPSCTIERGRDG